MITLRDKKSAPEKAIKESRWQQVKLRANKFQLLARANASCSFAYEKRESNENMNAMFTLNAI